MVQQITMEIKMQIEVGRTYNLNNGNTVTIDGMIDDGHPAIEKYGYGPFLSNEMGLFHIDGRFGDGNNPELDIVSECVTGQAGTIAELGVKAGDVVECVYSYNIEGFKRLWTEGNMYAAPKDGALECDGNTPQRSSQSKFRIISRANTADTTPKTWGEMADAEKGAIALEYIEGNVQVSGSSKTWAKAVHPFASSFYYRIKPEPKRETVALYGADNGDGWAFPAAYDRFHRITFDTIDGEPDCGSVKMEAV